LPGSLPQARLLYCDSMDEILQYIRRELRYRLSLADDEVLIESASVLSDRTDTRGAVITLANFKVSAYQGQGLARPDLLDSLEMLLLFSFRFRHYEDSLRRLYETLRLFHEKPTHTKNDSHPESRFPEQVEKVFFTLVPLEIEALRDLWGMLGGLMVPSALFSVRVVRRKPA
jgi:hypothetical protein